MFSQPTSSEKVERLGRVYSHPTQGPSLPSTPPQLHCPLGMAALEGTFTTPVNIPNRSELGRNILCAAVGTAQPVSGSLHLISGFSSDKAKFRGWWEENLQMFLISFPLFISSLIRMLLAHTHLKTKQTIKKTAFLSVVV